MGMESEMKEERRCGMVRSSRDHKHRQRQAIKGTEKGRKSRDSQSMSVYRSMPCLALLVRHISQSSRVILISFSLFVPGNCKQPPSLSNLTCSDNLTSLLFFIVPSSSRLHHFNFSKLYPVV
ncbi:hypothetical protein V6N13_143668 [Hibiscus sabdariffa]|uniref:Uncharacterized protein n=1 Tax=Hibiscus sabdariffa TaxID=183260 RepID=A0ABR2FI29_9ROSI